MHCRETSRDRKKHSGSMPRSTWALRTTPAFVDPGTAELLRHLTFDPIRDDKPTGAPEGPRGRTTPTLYRRRNEIERLFGRIERFRRVFTRYDKTVLMFSVFVTVAFIADGLR
jgi:hypothetical protein